MKAKLTRATQRSFSWGIKTTDISFMRPGRPEVPVDGCDCGCGVVAPAAPKKRVRGTAKRSPQ